MLSSAGIRSRVVATAVDDATPTGVVIGIGAAVVVGATLLASVVPAADDEWRLVVVGSAVGAVAAVMRDRLALAFVVVLAWLLVNGFLVDRFGELSWHGPADVVRAVMLVVAGAIGLASGYIRRLVDRRRRDRRVDDELMVVLDSDEEVRDA